jgi:hypothetical protein
MSIALASAEKQIRQRARTRRRHRPSKNDALYFSFLLRDTCQFRARAARRAMLACEPMALAAAARAAGRSQAAGLARRALAGGRCVLLLRCARALAVRSGRGCVLGCGACAAMLRRGAARALTQRPRPARATQRRRSRAAARPARLAAPRRARRLLRRVRRRRRARARRQGQEPGRQEGQRRSRRCSQARRQGRGGGRHAQVRRLLTVRLKTAFPTHAGVIQPFQSRLLSASPNPGVFSFRPCQLVSGRHPRG